MNRIVYLLLLTTAWVIPSRSQAQLEGVKECIYTFFEGMHQADTTMMRRCLDKEAVLSTLFVKHDQSRVHQGSLDQLMQSVSQLPPNTLYEALGKMEVTGDQWVASATMPYSFYYKDSLLHCGTNSFTLVKQSGDWLITQIFDTRYDAPCPVAEARLAIDELITNWHLAASEADSAAYFDQMTVDARYLGTDKTEHWSKVAFTTFAAPYFAKGKAWDFKTIKRHVYSDDYENFAWFDETLDTWMGVCRGSGIVTREGNKWKIKHYVLSMTINNDKVREVIEIHKK